MDESINNIYFLKETISKFKNEIQKFITDPQYANSNAVNIRHSLEDLEKTILNKEKNIAGQILNNNSPSYNPIISKYSSNNLMNNNNLQSDLNNYGFKGKKTYFSEVINNLSKSENLGHTSLSSSNINNNYNNGNYKSRESIKSLNNIYPNNTNNNLNEKLSMAQKGLNLTASPRLQQRSLGSLGGISKYSLSSSGNLNNNPYLINNNRYEIHPEIKNASENYYELKYTAKRKALNLENLAAVASIENNSVSGFNPVSPERSEIFLRKINGKLTEENEKAYFKSTLMVRRINDEIHDKIQVVEKNFKENKVKQNLIDKYDISHQKLNKIKVKRSAGNINYMDRKKIQKFAFDKRSFFNSVNLDKNQLPIITPEEIERGLLAMITRGVIPKQADLTPAFNRDGHPISLAAGEALREIYGKNNFKDEIQIENNQSLERVKLNVDIRQNNKDKGFFLTAAQGGANADTKNAVKAVPKISLFNNISKKNHKINDHEIADKDKIKEISEFGQTRMHDEKFMAVDNLNKAQESIDKFNNDNEKIKNTEYFSKENNGNSDLNLKTNSEANKNFNAQEDENVFLKNKGVAIENINTNNKYSASYYQTENILHSKINLTKPNFFKGTENNANNNLIKIQDEENISLSENMRSNKSLTKFSQKEEKEILHTETKQQNLCIVEQNDSNIMENIENEMQKRSLIQNNLSETYTNTDKLLILKIKNFRVVQNQDYNVFMNENEENWGKINYLINHIQKLFKKLNFTNEEIDTKKLLNLANDELANVTNKDLILLMTDRLLKQRGFGNKKVLHLNLKEAFIVRIQNYFRMFSAKKKYLVQRSYEKKVIRIQHSFRLFMLKKIYKILLENKKRERLNSFRSLLDSFKKNWREIKKGPRFEIHINSYGFDNFKNATFEKFNERQNNQLNRIINLKDPNIEIIYVCPFEIGNEVLSYYFSILSTMGIENAKERFHLVVPDEMKKFAPSFCLSQMLLFSSKSLEKIRRKIANKNAYIVPGIVSNHDYFLAHILNCPILTDEFELTSTIFTKSGSKRVFELTNIPFPISAWDVQTEAEFYETLADLIKKYLHVNVWLFKIDNEINGRGIAYLQLDKIKSFIELKKEKANNSITDETFLVDLKNILIRSVPKFTELATPKLYKNFRDFFKTFLRNHGIIESCPTSLLSGITGSPCVFMFIEPDGALELLGTFDKINLNYFKNVSAMSPQKSAVNLNAETIVDKIGNYLYKLGIFGYVTVEYISFMEGQRSTSWAIDLKFGHTDIISCNKFCDFLDNYSLFKSNNSKSSDNTSANNISENSNENNNFNNLNKITNNSLDEPANISPSSRANKLQNADALRLISDRNQDFSHIKKPFKDMENHFRFCIPVIISPEISNMKMRELVQLFRAELLIFDLEKRNGIVFNLPDIIQCAMFGICGVASDLDDLVRMVEKTINLIKSRILKKESNIIKSVSSLPNITRDNFKVDNILFSDLLGRILHYVRNLKK